MQSRMLLVAIALGAPVVASAATFSDPLVSKAILEILRGFIRGVMYVGTPALVVLIVWTGFLFVAARGSSEGLTKAKKMALTTLIGSVLLLGLWALVTLAGNTFGGLSAAALLLVLGAFFAYVLFKG